MRRVQPVLYLYIALFLSVVACGPLALQANVQGNQAFAQKNYDDALQAYERTQDITPGSPEALYNSGNAYYRQREFVEAKARLQQALRDADEQLAKRSLFNLGNAYFNSFEFDRAIEAYKEVLRLDPNDVDAKHNLELALRQLLRETDVGSQPQQEQEQEGQDQQEQAQEQENQQSPEQQDSQPPQPQRLTEDQAKQLLESVAQDTETLRDRTRQIYVVPSESSGKDW